jgi:hypothetical protein
MGWDGSAWDRVPATSANGVLINGTVNPGNTANTTPWLMTTVPRTSGGCSWHSAISAASTNATVVKSSAGQVYAIYVTNTNASPRYIKLYNVSSSPTVGTTTVFARAMIPADTTGNGFVVPIPAGVEFTTGIAYGLTTGSADNDTGTVAAGEIIVNVWYK